jgi:hypothetical protein
MDKKYIIIGSYVFIAGIFVMLLCSLISAVAVGGAYSTSYPVEVYPGESKEIYFVLQNMAGGTSGQDLKFSANVELGSELVKIKDASSEYLVPFGSSDVRVNVLVTAPKNAQVGSTYDSKIAFSPIPTGAEDEGMVQLAIGLSRYFTVKIVEKPIEPILEKPVVDKTGNLLFWIVLIVIIIAVVGLLGYFIWKRRK